jgi:hypothetical protein
MIPSTPSIRAERRIRREAKNGSFKEIEIAISPITALDREAKSAGAKCPVNRNFITQNWNDYKDTSYGLIIN